MCGTLQNEMNAQFADISSSNNKAAHVIKSGYLGCNAWLLSCSLYGSIVRYDATYVATMTLLTLMVNMQFVTIEYLDQLLGPGKLSKIVSCAEGVPLAIAYGVLSEFDPIGLDCGVSKAMLPGR